MRYPDDHKEKVRSRIVEAASRALRKDGLAGVSIPALMKKAGLTHGGFYAHFKDREELVAEAVRFAYSETGERLFGDEEAGIEQALAIYLSPEHVRGPAGGCVLAALGTEASHQSPVVRRSFAEAARGLVRGVDAKLHPERKTKQPSDAALALVAQMVGAVMLARLVDDDALAKRLLAAARQIPQD